MAVKVLTQIRAKAFEDREHITLIGKDDVESWMDMPQEDTQAQTTQASQGTVGEPLVPVASNSEASSSADGMPPPPTSATSSSKKRRPSRPKLSSDHLRRAASTPHIRGLAHTETSPLSPNSDKQRRNKLGYHRTSVACGHCRRRKIRCLLAADDAHGRCLNCIRLKKDCHFYPVDQGPPEKSTSTRGSDKLSKTMSASNQSSPRTSAPSESIDGPSNSGENLSLQEPFSVHSSKQSSELDFSGSPMDGAPFQSPTFSYQGMSDNSHWGTPSLYGNHTLAEDPNTPQSAVEFWPQQHPPGSAIFQHRGSIPMGLDHSSGIYMPQNEGNAWSGLRSMSVGDASAMPHLQQFQQTYRQTYQTSPYPYAFTDGSNPSLPIATQDQDAPIPSSAPQILPSQSFPQGWNTFAPADQATPTAEQHQVLYGAQWYNEPGVMSAIDENLPTSTDPGFAPNTQPG